MFNIKYQKAAADLLPWFLRSTKMKQFIGVLAFGNKLIGDRFNSYRLARDYELNFTGQTIYLERWLNEVFDPTNKGITITNSSFKRSAKVYNKIEQRDRVVLYNKSEAESPFYAYNKNELTRGISFSVNLPANLPANKTNKLLVSNEVDKFVVAGRNYEIKNI